MHESEQRRIFDNWLAEHKGILFKVIRAYARHAYDQEDLFQEIALQVWKSVPDYRGEAKVSTWIYRVALYAALAWSRKERTQPPTQDLAAVAHTLVATEAVPDERIHWLYEQLAQLEPIDRSICLLLFEGFKYREIAELLGISESNVGVKLNRIKTHLARMSKEKAQDDPAQ
ncbi:MAG: sigma-70 family RNA polymerase sigma factor [Caldilineaceae bacterium]